MINVQQILAAALEYLMGKVDQNPALRAERDAAAAHFFVNREPDDAATARFEEWFLFERLSPGFGDVPAFISLAAMNAASCPPAVSDMLDELGSNHYGVFELLDSGEARDLLSGREFVLDEVQVPVLSEELDEGAVLVGRLFAAGRASHVFGAGVAAVAGEVAQALREDLTRRGEDRKRKVSQLEMEKLLFMEFSDRTPSTVDDPADLEPLERIEADIESWLREAGLPGVDMDDLQQRFLETPTMAEAVGPLLEEVAFETQADLETGRRLLPAYYRAVHAKHVKGAIRPAKKGLTSDDLRGRASDPCRCGSGKPYAECCLPRDAVARFEEGRAQGKDLNELIQGLESAMGLDGDDDEDSEPEAIGAAPPVEPMVMEFVWERDKMGQALEPGASSLLKDLAKSIDGGDGAPGDLTEVLPAHIARFVFFDRYCGSEAPSPASVEKDLDAIRGFTAWLRDEQGVNWCEFSDPICQQEQAAGARIANANQLLGPGESRRWNCAFQVTRITRRGPTIEAELEAVHSPAIKGTIEVPANLAALLEAGDCLAVATDLDTAARLPEWRKHGSESDKGPNLQARLLRILPAGAREFLVAGATRKAN